MKPVTSVYILAQESGYVIKVKYDKLYVENVALSPKPLDFSTA